MNLTGYFAGIKTGASFLLISLVFILKSAISSVAIFQWKQTTYFSYKNWISQTSLESCLLKISFPAIQERRDFYDIYNLNENFKLDFKSNENIEICKNIFYAKRVPLEFIKDLPSQKDLHRQSWNSVVSTIGSEKKSNLKDFDYYFDYVIELFKHLHT